MGLGDSLTSPHACMPYHIDEMAGDNQMSSMKLPLLKAVEGAATYCTPGMDHRPSQAGTHVCQGYPLIGLQHCKP